MKTFIGILLGAALVAMVSSCDINKLPTFDDRDSFVAFDATSYSVNENVGVISIPVTIASVNTKVTNVAYTVTDSTAVQGKNYTLVDSTGVLRFDGSTRTQYINVQIMDINEENYGDYGYSSAYTGNMAFTISLINGGAVNLGYDCDCIVTILDLNHPLADIVGTYTATGDSSRYGDNYSWTMTLSTDDNNETMVWFHAFDPYMTGLIEDVYGTVSDDKRTITIDVPFWAGEYNGYYMAYIYSPQEGYYSPTNTTINLTYNATTGVWTADKGYMVAACLTNGDVNTIYSYYEAVYNWSIVKNE